MELKLNGAYIEEEKIEKLIRMAEGSGWTLAQLNCFLFDQAVRDPLHAKGWLPIDQMPKDGTHVLVWAEGLLDGEEAWYEEGGNLEKHYTHFHHMPLVPVIPQWALDMQNENKPAPPQ